MDLGGDNNGNDRSGFNGCFYGSVYGSGNVVGSNSLTDIVTDTTNNGLSSSVKSNTKTTGDGSLCYNNRKYFQNNLTEGSNNEYMVDIKIFMVMDTDIHRACKRP